MAKEIKKGVPKRVAYLFGAGATQANISAYNSSIDVSTVAIKDGMLKKAKRNKHLKNVKDLINVMSHEKSDIEHLITLIEACGTKKHALISKELKKIFHLEILERIEKLPRKYIPQLYAALIDMYNMPDLNEEITGILTLNYEDHLEKAMMAVNDSLNYGIMTIDTRHPDIKTGEGAKNLVLKLHGSFNWKNDFPIRVKKRIKEEADILWIPPGVEKKRDRYPFSILWGKAMEVLRCDILRVVGCSLNRNDWQLISLLYTTQQVKPKYNIEIIDYIGTYDKIKENYPYLVNLKYFTEVDDIKKLGGSVGKINRTDQNVFAVWLKAKAENYYASHSKITTDNYFQKFHFGEL